MLPYVEARTKVQFKATKNPLTAGALYEETCTQFGLYNEGDWGCNTGAPAKNGASSNSYIRFHWTGALELSLMVLDYFDLMTRPERERERERERATLSGFH